MRQRIWNHRGTRQSGASGRSSSRARRSSSRGHGRTDGGAQSQPLELLEGRRLFAIPAGPDGFGYEAVAHPYEEIDLELSNGGVAILDHHDDEAVALSLGSNTFSFYGQTYTTLLVSTNGFITFGTTVAEYDLLFKDASGFNDALTSNIGKPMIAPHWADLRSDHNAADTVFYRFEDGATSDRLIIEWSNVRRTTAPSASIEAPITFQTILQLNTGNGPGSITFNYKDITTEDFLATNGGRTTVGIKGDGVQSTDPSAMRLLVSGPSTTSLQGDGSAIRISSNRPPVLAPLPPLTVDEGRVTLTASATDPDNDVLTYSWDLDGDGTFETQGQSPTFTVDGPASFTVSVLVSDSRGKSATGSTLVTIKNVAPTAVADEASGVEDTVIVDNVLKNDTDPADPLTAQLLEGHGPLYGDVVLLPSGDFTYTPHANYNGPDSFTYTVNDGDGGTATATVTLHVAGVNDAPVALADAYPTDEDTALVVDMPGVLGNDSDVDGDTLTALVIEGPAHGALALAPNGSFTYTPHANYNGPDSFTYRVTDGAGEERVATVSITVNAVNDRPVAGDDAATTDEDSTSTGNVLGNDGDIDGPAGNSEGASPLTADLVSLPLHGTVTLSADGAFTYVPEANYFGTDSFTYQAVDAAGAKSAPATVTVTVNPVNDTPVAKPEAYAMTEDTTLDVLAGGLLTNDTDIDGDTLTVQVATAPERGVLTLNPDGTFEYVPGSNFAGDITFTYTVSDRHAKSEPATVTLSVAEVNDMPVAGADYGSTTDLEPTTGNVLVNDSDVDDVALTAALVPNQSLAGALVFNSDGTFTYTPVLGFSGVETFSYVVSDGRGGQGVGVVEIKVTAEEAPEGTIQLVEDPTVPGKAMLVVNGTDASETLAVVHHWNGVQVYFGFESRGVYQPTGRIIVRGNGGDDVLLVGPAVQLPAWLYGDGGNDVVKLGHGGGIAFGGAGNDLVSGGNGRDLLVGGEGADALFGLAGDDVLIAGYTTYDNRAANADHEAAWSHLHAEWVSSRTFEQRVASLGGGGGGSNGSYFLNEATVEDDAAPGAADILTGSGGHDWFIYTFGEDRVTALTVTEAPYDLGVA